MLRSWLHILLPLAILGLAIAAQLSEPVAVVNIRAMVFDTFQRIEPREYTPLPVRIVDLDDASLEKIGQWPWPRTVVAEMVTRLTELGAAVVRTVQGAKTYGVDIVIGENTEKLIDGMAMLEMDLIQVKGKTVPVRIFTLHGDEEMHDSAVFQSQMSRHNYMLQTYRAQDWEKAKNFLSECRVLDKEGRLGKLYDLYDERIAEFESHPPPADWDGVFVATSK